MTTAPVYVRPSPSPQIEWLTAEFFCTIAYDKRMVPITCVGPFVSMDLAMACGDELRVMECAATVMVHPMRPPPQDTLLSLLSD